MFLLREVDRFQIFFRNYCVNWQRTEITFLPPKLNFHSLIIFIIAWFFFQQQQSLSRKSHRKKGRSSHKDEKTTESEATTSKQENIHLLTSEKPSSFERNYKDRTSGRRRYNNASEKQQMRQGSKDSRKKIPELYNDYTRYQYHRKSNKVGEHQQNSNKKKKPGNQHPTD